MKQPIKLLVITWFSLMLFATIILVREYAYVREQSYKIVALKGEYENHLMAVSRVLHDYNSLRERLDSLEIDNEKKNDIAEGKQAFPEGVRVVSSDTTTTDGDSEFVVINRELNYLKQSTIDFIRKQKLSPILDHISPNQWRDYTDHIEQKKPKKPSVRKKRRRKASRSAAGYLPRGRMPRVERVRPTDFEFSWPVERSNVWLSSFFGPRKKANGAPGFHYGLDMAACKGTPVYAAGPGVVIEARGERDSGGYGNTVVIAHNRKYRTRYAHLQKIKVRTGEHVARGAIIGTVGDTGLVRSRGKDASHLHFEVSVFGKKVDPLAFLS